MCENIERKYLPLNLLEDLIIFWNPSEFWFSLPTEWTY